MDSKTPMTNSHPLLLTSAKGTRRDGRRVTITEAVPADFARELETLANELADALESDSVNRACWCDEPEMPCGSCKAAEHIGGLLARFNAMREEAK